MWQRIRTLIVKELLAVWRDPKSRMILIVPPLIQMLVFSFAATQEVKNVRDRGAEPRLRAPARATWWRGSRARRTSPRSTTCDDEDRDRARRSTRAAC